MLNIEKFLKMIYNPILSQFKRIVIKPLRSLRTLPLKMAKKIRDPIRKMLNAKEKSLKNYVSIGRYYVSKRLLAFALIILCVLIFFIFIKPPAFIDKFFHRTKVIHAQSDKPIAYSGKAKLYDEQQAFRYEGDFVEGQYEGLGKLYDVNGILIYEGEFKKGLYNGNGSEYSGQGVPVYRGQFVNGIHSGQGILFYPNGNIQYKGEFQNGLFSGSGALHNPQGLLQYEGGFSSGNFNGQGKKLNDQGIVIYEGGFTNNEYSGSGKLFNDAGSILYEGGFAGGKFSGEGTAYYANGHVKYVGSFLAGAYGGQGALYNEAGGPLYEGSFVGGKFQGIGTVYDESGKPVYQGDFKNNVYDGWGVWFDEVGTVVYTGFFKQGHPYFAGFLNQTSQKIKELLGDPSNIDVSLPEESVPDAGSSDTDAPSPIASSPPAGPISLMMNYTDIQLLLTLLQSPSQPAEARVITAEWWNSELLLETEKRIAPGGALDPGGANGFELAVSRLPVGDNLYMNVYTRQETNLIQYRFYYTVNSHTLIKLAVIQPE